MAVNVRTWTCMCSPHSSAVSSHLCRSRADELEKCEPHSPKPQFYNEDGDLVFPSLAELRRQDPVEPFFGADPYVERNMFDDNIGRYEVDPSAPLPAAVREAMGQQYGEESTYTQTRYVEQVPVAVQAPPTPQPQPQQPQVQPVRLPEPPSYPPPAAATQQPARGATPPAPPAASAREQGRATRTRTVTRTIANGGGRQRLHRVGGGYSVGGAHNHFGVINVSSGGGGSNAAAAQREAHYEARYYSNDNGNVREQRVSAVAGRGGSAGRGTSAGESSSARVVQRQSAAVWDGPGAGVAAQHSDHVADCLIQDRVEYEVVNN